MPTSASEIVDEIQKLYSDDPLPWIVGYSGGKDSSAVILESLTYSHSGI